MATKRHKTTKTFANLTERDTNFPQKDTKQTQGDKPPKDA